MSSSKSSPEQSSLVEISNLLMNHLPFGRDFRLTDVYGEVVKEIFVSAR